MNRPYYVFEQVAFALLTGARRNEIRTQRWEWIDWDAGVVRVMTSKDMVKEIYGRVQEGAQRPVLSRLEAGLLQLRTA